ncbi:hypothetical protein METBIDRAFT_37239 [Metschnikowia bicuspidata var. bicuspidata NRRL YB-4993]|uniref:Phosphatidylinositol N-acetylglucosaminyltransferase subunit H conserved domain-containing protein n=1 Tax=Metschnikowia bicuspidata var. bicuspidata NRRL YB-4993 TaxID=869754 RepID=A0A1A0HIC6_9ASCO|nr:hypothetical protein METBIDRAFT_37239 [Metschnikowia bicuspidata var. bicuspidata NRRL YB-4993]OBA23751.1 hypothetical protein METBIDRAFT_37239 [Metschnikowia bicuspidata var. bicuspidata NRRL YB-4993]
MSSAKDYAFEIVTSANQSSVKFIVRNKPSFFARHLRVPVAFTLLACLVPQGLETLHAWREHGWHAFSPPVAQLVQLALRPHSVLPGILGNALAWLPWTAAVAAILLLLSLEEASDTLMVMGDLGVQISSRSKWKLLNVGRHGKFVPISEIIDIVIHEGFHGYGQVVYYMCVLTRDKGLGGNAVQVIFPHFLPRKEILLQVWKLSRQMLYGKTRRHYRHVPGQGLTEVQHLHE